MSDKKQHERNNHEEEEEEDDDDDDDDDDGEEEEEIDARTTNPRPMGTNNESSLPPATASGGDSEHEKTMELPTRLVPSRHDEDHASEATPHPRRATKTGTAVASRVAKDSLVQGGHASFSVAPSKNTRVGQRYQHLQILPPTLVPPQREEDVGQIAQGAAPPFVDATSDAVAPGAYRIRGRARAHDEDDEDDTVWNPADPPSPPIPDAMAIEGVLASDVEEMQRLAMEEAERRIRQDAVVATNVLAEDSVVQANVPAREKMKKWILAGAVFVLVLAAVGTSLALTLGPSTGNSAPLQSSIPTFVPSQQPSPAPSTSSVPSMSLTYPWNQLGQDIDGDAVDGWSGYSISLSADGMTLAIGAPGKHANSLLQSGQVQVHHYLDGFWVQLGQDIDGKTLDGQSGRSVSLSANGNLVAIGAPYAHNRTGYVQVYQLEGETWVQVGSTMNGTAAHDWFGGSVSMSSNGNYVIVGADQFTDENNSLEGYACVYHLEGGDWSQVGQTLVGEAAGDLFGWSVSMSADGETIAMGGILNDGNGINSGHVQVYHLEGSNWSQVGQDIDGEAPGDNSGRSVALSANGTTVAIGAWGNSNDNGRDAGHVRVYTLHNGTSWRQVGQDIDGKAARDKFGVSVALSDDGTFLAAGADQYSDTGSLPGYASVYQLVDGSWEQVGPDLIGEAAGDFFGYSNSMSGDGRTVATGGYRNNGNVGENSGHVHVYQLMD